MLVTVSPRKASSATSSSSTTAAAITPREYDVLFGRGRKYFGHPGNLRMLQIIQESKDIYNASSKTEKKCLTKRTIERIRKMEAGCTAHPPVRFLKLRKDGSGLFVEATRKEVHDKVSHCYREHKTILKEICAIRERKGTKDRTLEPMAGFQQEQGEVVVETIADDTSSPVRQTARRTTTTTLPHDDFFQQRNYPHQVPYLGHDSYYVATSADGAKAEDEERINARECPGAVAFEFTSPDSSCQEQALASYFPSIIETMSPHASTVVEDDYSTSEKQTRQNIVQQDHQSNAMTGNDPALVSDDAEFSPPLPSLVDDSFMMEDSDSGSKTGADTIDGLYFIETDAELSAKVALGTNSMEMNPMDDQNDDDDDDLLSLLHEALGILLCDDDSNYIDEEAVDLCRNTHHRFSLAMVGLG